MIPIQPSSEKNRESHSYFNKLAPISCQNDQLPTGERSRLLARSNINHLGTGGTTLEVFA